MTHDVQGLDVARGLTMLKRNALIVLLLTALGAGLGYAGATARAPEHTATATVLIGSTDARSYQDALDGTVLSGRLMSSYAGLIGTEPLLDDVRRATGSSLSSAELKGKLTGRAEPSTLLLHVIATDPDPDVARELSDAAASALVGTVESLGSDVSKIVTADVVDPAGVATPSALRAEVAGTAAGAVLGLLLATLIGLIRSARDCSIRGMASAERAFGAPVLAAIPTQPALKRGPVVITQPASAGAEAFRELRTALLLGGNSPRTLLVTSPLAGDGKSVVASNLAAAFALTGQRVLLVDADLRRGRVAQQLSLRADVGITSVLNGHVPATDAIQRWQDVFQVVTSGPVVPNPAELLGSSRMASLLQELAGEVDVVIVDAPPVIAATDAVVLSTLVDAVLVVAREGETAAGPAAETRRRLARVGAEIRGVVLNDVSKAAARSYYADVPAITQDAGLLTRPAVG